MTKKLQFGRKSNRIAKLTGAIFLMFGVQSAFAQPSVEANFSNDKTWVEEGNTSISIDVEVNNMSDAPVSLQLTANEGSTAIAGVNYNLGEAIVAEPGESEISFTLYILKDNAIGGKYVALNLSSDVEISSGDEETHVVLIADIDNEIVHAPAFPAIGMTLLTSIAAEGAAVAEISAHDPISQRLFVTNSEDAVLMVYDFSNPLTSSIINTIDVTPYGGGINSVAVSNGLVAIAIEGNDTDERGTILFIDADGNYINDVEAGFLPDMVTFTHDGMTVLVANEGEPNDDYDVDPEGSISIIDVSTGAENATVVEAGFTQFNDQIDALKAAGVRIFGPGATVAQDLEPEYIAVTSDNSTAYVSLQEANAFAIVDIATATVTEILPLGYKNYSMVANQFDASDRSDDIFMATWDNVFGMYHPDGITSFNVDGQDYIITANEGDARDYDGYSEEDRVKDLDLDPTVFPYADILQRDELLGRSSTTYANGDTDGDGDYDEIYLYGARSFSIWNTTTNTMVYDSGDQLESIVMQDPTWGPLFNSTDDELELMNRSDDKGPEPEGVITGVIGGKTYAFVILERMSGAVAYDVSNPMEPQFIQYLNNRNEVDGEMGDLAPEGILFIEAADSPTGVPMLVISNEVSGTLTVIELDELFQPEPCEDFATYLSNVNTDGTSTIYGVSIDEEASIAELTELNSLAYPAHIAYNENNGLLYAVNSGNGYYQSIDVSTLGGAISPVMPINIEIPDAVAAVIDMEGNLLIGSRLDSKIYSVDLLNGEATDFTPAFVNGGDLAIDPSGTLYMVTKNSGNLYIIEQNMFAEFIGDVTFGSSGLAYYDNGSLLVSAVNSSSLEVKTLTGLSAGSFQLLLDGETFTTSNGDMASGCVPSNNNEACPESGACYATAAEYNQGTQLNGTPLPVNRTDINNAIGSPEGTDELVFTTIGYGGSIILEFDGAITNGEGADLQIVETSFGATSCNASGEYADISVSENGDDWYFLGTVCKFSPYVDISDAEEELNCVVYVKIENNIELNSTPDGYDLDGVVALHNCLDSQESAEIELITSNQSIIETGTISSSPNPTAGNSKVEFTTTTNGHALLEVYDLNGRSVEVLFNQNTEAGLSHTINYNALHLPNGIYVYKLTTANETIIEKFMLSK